MEDLYFHDYYNMGQRITRPQRFEGESGEI